MLNLISFLVELVMLILLVLYILLILIVLLTPFNVNYSSHEVKTLVQWSELVRLYSRGEFYINSWDNW